MTREKYDYAMTVRHLLVGVFVLRAVLPLFAQSAEDEAAVRARLAAYAEARNKRDAHAEAMCYTEDGDFRSSLGPFVSGRAAIEKQLTVNDPTYHFNLEIARFRFINPTTAIVDAEVKTGTSKGEGLLVADYLVVKQGNVWLISAGRIATKPAPGRRRGRPPVTAGSSGTLNRDVVARDSGGSGLYRDNEPSR